MAAEASSKYVNTTKAVAYFGNIFVDLTFSTCQILQQHLKLLRFEMWVGKGSSIIHLQQGKIPAWFYSPTVHSF